MIDTQAIRTKILDLAMYGKLTDHFPEDGTAEELYQRIQADKKELLRAGKIKKEKPLPAIVDKDMPFDLPDNWRWVRLQDITSNLTLNDGDWVLSDDMDENGEVKLIQLGSIGDLQYRNKGFKHLTRQRFEELNGKQIYPGYLLINRLVADKMLLCILPEIEGVLITAVDVCWVAPQNKNYNIQFLMYALASSSVQQKVKEVGYGVTRFRISKTNLIGIPFPFPPLAEQQRIVEKIEQAFSVLDTIDSLQAQYADNLTVLKEKLIDAAIQGKLTEQLPEDGTAEELYQLVQEERKRQEAAGTIKAVELAPAISDVDKPFSIPASWKWTNLGNVSYIVRGGSPRPIKQYITTREDGINWIKIGDVEKGGKYIYSTHEKIIPEGEAKSRRVYPGDFLLTNSMSFGRPYISKIEGCIHDGWLLIHGLNGFDPDYLYYLLSSTYLYGQFTVKASGSTVDNLNIDKVKAAIIPLPPLAEQKRIAQKIDELMPIFEK